MSFPQPFCLTGQVTLKPEGTEGREECAGKSMGSTGQSVQRRGALLPGCISPVLPSATKTMMWVTWLSPVGARAGACPALHLRSHQNLASCSAKPHSPVNRPLLEAGEAKAQSREATSSFPSTELAMADEGLNPDLPGHIPSATSLRWAERADASSGGASVTRVKAHS